MSRETRYPYHINIFYNAEDDDYIADVPDFKYVSAFGATPEDALREVLVALELTIEVLQDQGKPLPAATYRPAYLTE